MRPRVAEARVHLVVVVVDHVRNDHGDVAASVPRDRPHRLQAVLVLGPHVGVHAPALVEQIREADVVRRPLRGEIHVPERRDVRGGRRIHERELRRAWCDHRSLIGRRIRQKRGPANRRDESPRTRRVPRRRGDRRQQPSVGQRQRGGPGARVGTLIAVGPVPAQLIERGGEPELALLADLGHGAARVETEVPAPDPPSQRARAAVRRPVTQVDVRDRERPLLLQAVELARLVRPVRHAAATDLQRVLDGRWSRGLLGAGHADSGRERHRGNESATRHGRSGN